MASAPWEPLRQQDRYASLDILRGLALFGVLQVNLLTFFSVSLFHHILVFHSHQGWVNHTVDVLVAALLEFKAFDLFSFLFGVGIAVQAKRAAGRSIGVAHFFVRRFLVLLAMGAIHLFFISNVDILVLYAVCGLLLIPTLRFPTLALGVLSFSAIVLPCFIPIGLPFPEEEFVRAHATRATRIYSEGGFVKIFLFRAQETWHLILPLLVGVFPKTVGLMLLGITSWRSGLLRNPQLHRRLLLSVLLIGGAVGGTLTTLRVMTYSTGTETEIPSIVSDLGSHIPLALAYAAALLMWLKNSRLSLLLKSFAAAGQMALTNYLTQSLVLAFVFYGYGFGKFGQLGPADAALAGIAIYASQLIFSTLWLRTYKFGPVEWLWRSLTYGQRQSFLRQSAGNG